MTITDSTLSIEPLALGTTGKNQLRAVDPAGLFVQQVFLVFVVTNLAPDTLMTIPDQTLTVAEGPVKLDLSTFYFDPDQDTLMYTAVSSNTGAATVSVSSDTLTITPVEKDMSSNVTVTATDGDLVRGAGVRGNREQLAASGVESTIGGRSTDDTSPTGPVELDLSVHFLDADGDTLSYAAVSSNTRAATVAVSGDQADHYAGEKEYVFGPSRSPPATAIYP